MTEAGYTYEQLEAAMCLWEAVRARENAEDYKGPAPWAAWKEVWGTAALRYAVAGLAKQCSADWHVWDGPDLGAIQEKYPAFDWDYCPEWLEKCVSWSGPGGVAGLAKQTERYAAMLGAPSDNLTPTSAPAATPEPQAPRCAPVCVRCSLSNIRMPAEAVWDADAQRWDMVCVFDEPKNGECVDCEGGTSAVWRDLAARKVLVQHHFTVVMHKVFDVIAPTFQAAQDAVERGDAVVDTPPTFDKKDGWTVHFERSEATDIVGFDPDEGKVAP